MTYGGVAVNAVRTIIPAGPARAQAGSGIPEITITAATQWASPGELMYTANRPTEYWNIGAKWPWES